jgi:tetratricopeptide (TPR) repeat protein
MNAERVQERSQQPRTRAPLRSLHGFALLSAFLLYFSSSLSAHSPSRQKDARALRLEAFDLAYNLDHDAAVALLRKAIELAPEDPAAHRSLAAVLWLNMLFKRGSVTVDHYLGSIAKAQVALQKPPPEIDAAFRSHVATAITLAERRVSAAPKDPQAHFDLGAAVGLRASYIATVEGGLLAGFRAARRAFDEHEKVLELDPSRKDAGLIVGTYRYIISSLSLPMRMMAYVAGFGGGKDRGVRMLQEAAASRGETTTDALFALALIGNRERRWDDALAALAELRRMYPRNRLVVLEAGATALRAGRGGEADRLLSEGLAMFEKDTREKIPGEAALWHYKRGAARARAQRTELAIEDLRVATTAGGQAWVTGRAHAELGKLSLARGDRKQAAEQASRAESLCRQGNDPPCVEESRRLLRSSHGR